MDCIPGLKEFTNDKKFTTDLSSHAIRVKFQSRAPADKLPYFVEMLNKIQAVEEDERVKHEKLKERAKEMFAYLLIVLTIHIVICRPICHFILKRHLTR